MSSTSVLVTAPDPSAWHVHRKCVRCGWRTLYKPPLVCPECGLPETKFVRVTCRWVNETVWYQPSTWGTGHWQEQDDGQE